MPFYPHWHIGGAFMVFFVSALAGLIFFIYCRIALPAFFKKQTLTRATPTLVPETDRRPARRIPTEPPRLHGPSHRLGPCR